MLSGEALCPARWAKNTGKTCLVRFYFLPLRQRSGVWTTGACAAAARHYSPRRRLILSGGVGDVLRRRLHNIIFHYRERMKKDICCIGHITKDRIVTPQSTVHMNGGTSLYFAKAFNSLPHRLSFGLVTKLAADDMQVVDAMRQEGIDIVAYTSARTVFFENKYGNDQNERTQRLLAKADPFAVGELAGVEAGVFHLGSLLADDFSAEVIQSLAGRGRISIDAQGFLRKVCGDKIYPTDWAEKDAILAVTDILKVNECEAETITGLADPHAAALHLAGKGVREVCLTLGSKGSLVYAEGNYYEIPAYPPREIVDATGCGDTYSAGYLYCRALGAGYEEAGRYAAAMCTLKIEHNGPFKESADEVAAVMSR